MSSGHNETNLEERKGGDRVVVGDENVRAALGQIWGLVKYQTLLGETLGERDSVLDRLGFRWSGVFMFYGNRSRN